MKSKLICRWLIPFSSMAVGLLLLLLGGLQLGAQAAPGSATENLAFVSTSDHQTQIDPLPGGCINGTPAGADAPVCCISGFVFVDGQPVAGAEVTIATAGGEIINVTTDLRVGMEARPFYALDLSRLVSPTEIITLTARYGGIASAAVQHVVQPGGQQRDLLIYDPNLLAVSGEVQETAAPGKFASPRDVAYDSQGNLYVLDIANFRIQVFNPAGELLPRPGWQKSMGNGPDQWTDILGMAIDPRTDTVYIPDAFRQRIMLYTTDGELLRVWDQTSMPTNFFGSPVDVAIDGQSNFYVRARHIYKYDAAGNFLNRWGPADGFPYAGEIAIAPSGEIYVTDHQVTSIYRYSASGEPLPFTFTHSVPITVPGGLAVDAANQVYIAAWHPNTFYRPRIIQAAPDGTFVNQWNYPAFNEAAIVSVDGMTIRGNTLYIADLYAHRLARLDTTADFLPPWGGEDDNPQRLSEPHGIAVMPDGPFKDHVFAADAQIARITLLITDTIRQSWAYTDVGEQAIWAPWNLTVDPQARLWVVDVSAQPDLSRFTLNPATGQLVRDGGPWPATVNGISFFNGLVDLAIDSAERIYMADHLNNRVVIYTATTPISLTQLAEFSGGTLQLPLALKEPQGIAIDEHDPEHPGAVVIYVADSGNNRLLKLHFADDQISLLATWSTLLPDPACGDGASIPLALPMGIVVDPAHNLYVADRSHNRIVKLAGNKGQCLATYGGFGYGSGRLVLPEGVALDSQGRLYVSDWGVGRVQHFLPMATSAPVATIVHLSSAELLPGATLTAIGDGDDGDATNQITTYAWSSDLGLSLTTNLPTIQIPTTLNPTTAGALGPGIHRLQLRVQDDEGDWSAPVTIPIFVERRMPELPITPVPTPDPAQPPPPPPVTCLAGGLWTFLLYLDGDYNDQGDLFSAYQQTFADLDTVDHACIQVFMQLDGHVGNTKRFYKYPGEQLTEIADFQAEIEMDTAAALGEFIGAGQQHLPADHYYLAIADHGDGARGIAWDHTSASDGSAYLTPNEIRLALESSGVLPVAILHLDACSMALLDVAYQLRSKVDYLITSQYLGWDFFAYADYARYAGDYPRPQDLAQQIVNRYAALAESHALPYTLAAIDLQRIEPVKNGFNELAALLKAWLNNDDPDRTRHQQVEAVRGDSQFFDSNGNFTNSPLDSYVDLHDWLIKLRASALNLEITASAERLLAELERSDGVILANRAMSNTLPGRYSGDFVDLSSAQGLSIYYPLEGDPQLATQAAPTVEHVETIAASQPVSYTQLYADYLAHGRFDFTRVTRWDEFLQAAYGAPGPNAPLEQPSPPFAPLIVPPHALYLPVVMR
jgi:sugar lactone lactonase YvrE